MTDLEVMNQMAKNGEDISLSTTVVSVENIKQGGLVTIGVDHRVANELVQSVVSTQTHIIALYVINKEQFKAIKNQS